MGQKQLKMPDGAKWTWGKTPSMRIKDLRVEHDEIIRLAIQGFTRSEIAEKLGWGKARIGQLLDSDAGRIKIAILQAERDREAVNFSKEMRDCIRENAKAGLHLIVKMMKKGSTEQETEEGTKLQNVSATKRIDIAKMLLEASGVFEPEESKEKSPTTVTNNIQVLIRKRAEELDKKETVNIDYNNNRIEVSA